MRNLTYSDIATLVDAGKTDEEIAAALAANPLTVRDVPVATLRELVLIRWRLIFVDPVTGERSGPLIDIYSDLAEAAGVGAGAANLARMIAQLMTDTGTSVVALSTNVAYAESWWALLPSLNLSPDQLAELATLTGGRRYEGVAEADVAACRLRYDTHAHYEAAMSACLTAIDAGESVADCKAALIAGWEGA